MDYFGFAVGIARIDPNYFWFDMDFRELESIVPAYREPWEQTRIIVQALTGERMKFSWDDEIAASNKANLEKEAAEVSALKYKRLAAADKLATMQIKSFNP